MNRLTAGVRDVVERYWQAGYFPCASVRVFDAQGTLSTVCVGGAGEDALFDAASLTKIATATRVLLRAQKGGIDLDCPVADCFEEIAHDAWLRERFAGVTLRMLLTHTSTLVPWYPFYSMCGQDFWTVLRHALQHTQPSEGVAYSDLNFMLLGKLLEKLSGLSLAQGLQKELVEPLGLGKMLYCPDAAEDIVPSCYDNAIEMRMCAERGIAFDGFRPMETAVRGTVNDGNAHYYFGDAAGHAGVFANTEAYARLCRFYMNSDLPLIRQAQQEQPESPTRGLGLQTGMTYPHGCGHTGFTGTSIYFSTQYNIGVVAFTNRLFFKQPSGKDLSEFRRALHECVFALGAQR